MQFYSPNRRLRVLIDRETVENYGGILSMTKAPQFVEFDNHMYETDDEEIIAKLKRSTVYSEEPMSSANFWPYKDPLEAVRKREEYVKTLEAEHQATRERLAKAEELLGKVAAEKKPAEPKTPKAE